MTELGPVSSSLACFTEAYRAITLAHAPDPTSAQETFDEDWRGIFAIQVDMSIVRRAGVLAVSYRLRTLDAIHLASAEAILGPDLRFATWDRRLWTAARSHGLEVLPATEPGLPR